MIDKPSITEIVGNYVELRRNGKERTGLCPFHSEKHPSFTVNDDKELFYCFGCGVGGDVIDFIERIEGIGFKEACKRLSLDTYQPRPRPYREQAEAMVTWAKETSIRIRDALQDIGDQIYICSIARKKFYADRELIAEHRAGLVREWAILCDLDDDLNDSARILELELWEQRRYIDALVEEL
jgi:DNA primase